MSKIDEQAKWFRQGRLSALDIAEEAKKNGKDPLEALKDEIKYVETIRLPHTMSKAQYQKAFKDIQIFTVDSVLLMAMATLHENEQWGADKLEEFTVTMNTYTLALLDGSIDFDGIKEMLTSVGMEVKFD